MGHIHQILVAVDGSPCSIAALSQAVTLAQDLGATIDVLHVAAPDAFEIGSSTASAASARDADAMVMEAAIADATKRLGGQLTRRSTAGDPVAKILEVAEATKPQLIVVGTHGRVGRLRSLVGSVAESVVRRSRCPVLTVREAAAAEQESFAERIHDVR